MTPIYTRHGKQVLRNGAHFADAADEPTAEELRALLARQEAARSPWIEPVEMHEINVISIRPEALVIIALISVSLLFVGAVTVAGWIMEAL